jgi:hypothetical protein
VTVNCGFWASLSFRSGNRTESSDLLAVLDELNPHALANSLFRRWLAVVPLETRIRNIRRGRLTYGVGLLGFDADLLENNALGVGRATEGAGLESSAESTLLVRKIRPPLLTAVVAQLAGRVETTGLSTGHFGCGFRMLGVAIER